jgi:arginyl-tRNA--protein-N-Asp/Glu arginylyltransferase
MAGRIDAVMTGVQKLGFYATPPHDCNYLPGREAVTLFADPVFPKNNRLYSALADCGFRRSGEHLYIPHCNGCSSCIPVRVPVAEFEPSRNQIRTLRRNADLAVIRRPAEFDNAHFELYRRYIAARHPQGGMDNPTPESYMEFLSSSWSDTVFFEMRRDGELVAVAVVDLMHDAMSAVYTFFEPALSDRSPGRFAVLYEIAEAARCGCRWLYLGYWIRQCRKMQYKCEYRPLEYFVDNHWQRLPPDPG